MFWESQDHPMDWSQVGGTGFEKTDTNGGGGAASKVVDTKRGGGEVILAEPFGEVFFGRECR